jgi:hydroxymethylpyrimidine/phosphomethylpyrimidine kinase
MLTSILTIAGFDPSAGAGVLADVKAFEYCRVQGQAVCTALTVQNENSFEKPNWLTWEQIKSQLQILSRVRNFNYIKIGLVENPLVLGKILKWLRKKYPKAFILWDPILKASSGFEFHKNNALSWLKLLRYVNLTTPNLPEAKFLNLLPTPHSPLPKTAILIKGGHAKHGKAQDLLFLPGCSTPLKFASERMPAKRHGSGCALSALIIANLYKYNDLEKSIRIAKMAMQRFFKFGSGKLGAFYL